MSLTPLRWLGAVAALTLALVAVTPAPPALACDCQQPTVDQMLERDPDAAIAAVRRIDEGGPAHGVGRVEHRIVGELPDELPLELDDGGSCHPAVAPGELAILAFERRSDGWATHVCGLLDPADGLAAAFGPLQVDPEATGPAAVAVTGGLPGADVAVLDDHLRVLQVTNQLPMRWPSLHPCGADHLVITGGTDDDTEQVVQLSLPDLDAVATHDLAGPDDLTWVEDIACSDDGRPTMLVVTEDVDTLERTVALMPDLDDGSRIELPSAEQGRLVDDDVVLLRGGHHGEGRAGVERFDPTTGTTTWVVDLGTLSTAGVRVSPDGGHVVVPGYDDGPVTVLLDAEDGTELARTDGPDLLDEPWMGDDRLVRADVEAGYLEGPRPRPGAILDLDLQPIGDLPALVRSRLVAGPGGVVSVGRGELAVADLEGAVHASHDPRLAGAQDAVLLAPVTGGDGPLPDTMLASEPADQVEVAVARDTAGTDGSGARRVAAVVAVTTSASVVLAAAAVRRRRSREPR